MGQGEAGTELVGASCLYCQGSQVHHVEPNTNGSSAIRYSLPYPYTGVSVSTSVDQGFQHQSLEMIEGWEKKPRHGLRAVSKPGSSGQ